MGVFQKSFDELLAAILTDYRNQFPGADTSHGSLIFIKSACLASALWGLYRHQDWIAQQIFPDTADAAGLEHHAWVRGITRRVGETDQELLARLLDHIRRPPAGGNRYDYVKWALSVTNVAGAWCIPLAQGQGTVDVVILADAGATGNEIPSTHTGVAGQSSSVAQNALMDASATFVAHGVAPGDIARNDSLGTSATVIAVKSNTELTLSAHIFSATGQTYALSSLAGQAYEVIDDLRPVTASTLRVLAPTVIAQNVTLTVWGDNIDLSTVQTEIEAYMATLVPGEDLLLSRLIALVMTISGVEDVAFTAPAANVMAAAKEMIRMGTITTTLGA